MATPTIKKETIQIALEKGAGTILVSRPDNTGKTIGLVHQFTYTGDAAMDLMHALATARRQLTAQMIAAAKPATATAKPAATATDAEPNADETDANDDEPTDAEPTGDEPAGDETDANDDEPTDAEPAGDDDPASAPPELKPITTDDQADDDLTDVGDIQALLF